MHTRHHNDYQVVPFPWLRVPIVDSLHVARNKPLMHALVEVDVTGVRQRLKTYRQQTGESLSFTAYIIACVARAVAEQRTLQAYRQGSKRLMFFDDVDVCTPVEHETENGNQATPYVIRAADRKSFLAIHREIRAAQAAGVGSARAMRGRRWYPHLPWIVRTAFWRAFDRSPRLKRRIGGTVMVTAVGMFGMGTGWGISTIADYTLQIVVGSIAEKPGVVDGRIDVRQFLCLTVTANHDVVDGAPLARFIARLKGLIESGDALEEAAAPASGSAVIVPVESSSKFVS